MKFSEIVEQASALVKRKGRITYRALQLEFDLDAEHLAVLTEELVFTQPQIVDEAGRGLVWVGEERLESGVQSLESKPVPFPNPRRPTLDVRPVSYTPSHLAERIRATTVTDGERKTITALFADLKGSTALIEGLDPEEARAIIDPALQLMMDAVHRYEGYVAQALGDGIFALFGAPISHEDHPQRALYAALRMQEEMRRYGDEVRLKYGVPLAMRVGINTGEVVMRSIRKDDLHADYVPVGHSTNLAARMEQMATPGSILVTAYTQRLTEGYFEFRSLGASQIKGVEAPLNVYEVLGAGPLRTRLQVAARRGLTRFVGRQSELEQMRKALAQAKTGHGQIVGVMGEAGLGKSRLFYEFKLLSHSGGLVLESYSVSHGKASPYLPVIELLKSYFDIKTNDDERKRREKVAGKVVILDRTLEESLPYLYALLGIEEQPSPLQQMDPQIRRRRTFDALKKLFLRESLNQPLILVFEDLHWIDSETQGFLDTLSEGIASAKILLLVNYRPEYRYEWGQKTYYTQLRLTPFGRAEAEEFLNELLGTTVGADGRSPLQGLKQLILEKTEGTPFFIEEVVQTFVEDGTLTGERGRYMITQLVTTLQLPTTVQGVLAARIDRLTPEEKALLQQLAVIGREFPLGLVRQVIAQPEDELYRLLSSLQHKEFLYEQPAFPAVEYLFKHALTQEVAYNSVLLERRKAQHEQTAQAIEQLYDGRLEEHYSELAHHYSRSSNRQKAVHFLRLAGKQAAQRSANAEAVRHFSAALELLNTMPDAPDHMQDELSLQVALGPALMATKGFAAPEVEKTYTRAHELCQQIGDSPKIFPVLFALALFHFTRAEHGVAQELGDQLLSLAQRTQDPALLLEAHRVLAFVSFWRGDVVSAREHAEQGVARYHAQHHRTHALLYGSDPGVVCSYYAADALWFLGYPDQAMQRCRNALTLADDLSHHFSSASARSAFVVLYQFRRESKSIQEWADATNAFCTEHEIPFWLAAATTYRGWALADQGQLSEGLEQMQQGIAAWRSLGTETSVPFYLSLLAEVYGATGQTEEGLSLLGEAMTLMHKTEERVYEAELYRLKGELLLTQESQSRKSKVENQKSENPDPKSQILDPQGEAEACFLKAIEIAQKQQAKSLELRATVSLVRLWQQQGKTVEAHQMLSAIYNWFTEGFDTVDLKEAKALLEELTAA